MKVYILESSHLFHQYQKQLSFLLQHAQLQTKIALLIIIFIIMPHKGMLQCYIMKYFIENKKEIKIYLYKYEMKN